jgi:hypothetical protein
VVLVDEDVLVDVDELVLLDEDDVEVDDVEVDDVDDVEVELDVLELVDVDEVDVLELVELDVLEVDVLELVELDVDEVVVAKVVVVRSVVDTGMVVVVVVEVVGTGQATPQQGRFGLATSRGSGDTVAVITGADVRNESSFSLEEVTGPEIVMPVLAARKVAPDGLPPGPVEITWPPPLATLIWQPSMSIVPPSADGLLSGSIGVAVRMRLLTVTSPSDRMLTSPPKLSPDTSISPLIVTLPRASNENSSLCPKPLLMPVIRFCIENVVPAEMSMLPPSPSTDPVSLPGRAS